MVCRKIRMRGGCFQAVAMNARGRDGVPGRNGGMARWWDGTIARCLDRCASGKPPLWRKNASRLRLASDGALKRSSDLAIPPFRHSAIPPFRPSALPYSLFPRQEHFSPDAEAFVVAEDAGGRGGAAVVASVGSAALHRTVCGALEHALTADVGGELGRL